MACACPPDHLRRLAVSRFRGSEMFRKTALVALAVLTTATLLIWALSHVRWFSLSFSPSGHDFVAVRFYDGGIHAIWVRAANRSAIDFLEASEPEQRRTVWNREAHPRSTWPAPWVQVSGPLRQIREETRCRIDKLDDLEVRFLALQELQLWEQVLSSKLSALANWPFPADRGSFQLVWRLKPTWVPEVISAVAGASLRKAEWTMVRFPMWTLALVFVANPATWFMRRWLHRYRRRRRIRRGLCVTCGYDLRGSESGVCSECGEPA